MGSSLTSYLYAPENAPLPLITQQVNQCLLLRKASSEILEPPYELEDVVPVEVRVGFTQETYQLGVVLIYFSIEAMESIVFVIVNLHLSLQVLYLRSLLSLHSVRLLDQTA